MIDSLYIGATGMQTQQLNVDSISNNLANVNTPGFKKGRVVFEDLFVRELGRNVGLGADGLALATQGVGLGAAVASSGKIFTDGDLKQSENPLDIAIRGRGFMEVVLADGSPAFTRSGTLQVNSEGFLTTPDGFLLSPSIQIPSDAKDIVIDATGKVMVGLPNQTSRDQVGQIELVNFINPSGLNPIGSNLYVATEKSGEPARGKAGDDGFGSISQGFIESSNVKLVDELINLVVAQRAYEVNAKVVQASDEMLGISNNLRR
jgi:flagellar basal-body rod protein FlgG